MAANIYTYNEVRTAILRGAVAMLLISQNIANKFMYLSSYQYNLLKTLQYDIYCLYSTIGNEIGFVGFNDLPPSVYENQFYGLVGSLIEKTKTVDAFGLYDGAANPNYQPPSGLPITVVVAGETFSSTIFYFTNQAPVTIANYNLIYQPIYGKTPGLTIVLETASESDWQTPATYNYATPGDPTTDLLSIVYDYPIPMTGYVIITGGVQAPLVPSSGGGTTPYIYTNAALLEDMTTSEWYLPLPLPVGKWPLAISVNGVGQGQGTYDTDYSPARLYAFGPSSVSQNIVVYVL